MTFYQELKSWSFPTNLETSPIPSLNSKAPSSAKLQFPRQDRKPVVIAFLRHCGCPFAERTFHQLLSLAKSNPGIHCIAISHSSEEATGKWLTSIDYKHDDKEKNIEIVVDEERVLYASWGLGVSSTWHVLNPWSMWNVYKLGKEEGIWNRPTESGSRWQVGGSFAVDGEGLVRWVGVNGSADEVPDFLGAVEALKGGEGGS